MILLFESLKINQNKSKMKKNDYRELKLNLRHLFY
jgi:hypothetical protein